MWFWSACDALQRQDEEYGRQAVTSSQFSVTPTWIFHQSSCTMKFIPVKLFPLTIFLKTAPNFDHISSDIYIWRGDDGIKVRYRWSHKREEPVDVTACPFKMNSLMISIAGSRFSAGSPWVWHTSLRWQQLMSLPDFFQGINFSVIWHYLLSKFERGLHVKHVYGMISVDSAASYSYWSE